MKSSHQIRWNYDYWIIIYGVILLIIGLLMVASASMVISDRLYKTPFHFLNHQLIYIVLGVMLATIVSQIPTDKLRHHGHLFFLLSLLLLLVVLIPGIGKSVNGSRRWLHLGFFSLQVSEMMKLTAILYLSSYLVRYQDQVRDQLQGFLKPMALAALIGGLLLLEPDFGAAVVITLTYAMLLFIAGVRLTPFLILLALVIFFMIFCAVVSPYRWHRLTSFLNPWDSQFGSGYQLTQSLIAFGRGGFFGVGLGNSVQKLFYLPEAHTDFLFAVLAEELGFIGAIMLIVLMTLLVGRVVMIGHRAYQAQLLYPAYLSFGVAFWLSLQTLINVGVNVGLLPTKGLTFPLISYGGSSMLMNCIALGIVLRISYETRKKCDEY